MNLVANKVKVCLITILVLLFLSPDNSYAQTPIYFDNFDDNDTSNWIVPRNTCTSGWQNENQQYLIKINGGCVTETIPADLVITAENYSFEVDMSITNINMDRNFVFKYTNPNNWYGIHIIDNNIYLHKVVAGTEYFLDNWHTLYAFEPNKTYHFKVNVFNKSSYEVLIDGVKIVTVLDQAPYLNNYSAGLQASAGGQPVSEVWFDNVVVTKLPDPNTTPTATSTATATATPEPTSTPTATASASPTPLILNVPDLKQYTQPWKNKIYAFTNKTIEEYGCALTSMSMILKYHGHNIDPQELNRWLKNQPDGYIRNGLLNWLAVTRYTKENDKASSPSLEFKRLSGGLDLIDNELLKGRPSILKEPGHFVVVKGKNSQGEYLINDPGYKNRTLLSSYQNQYLSLNSFTPSHTNLSYIMLVVNPSVTIEILDENGNTIPVTEMVEEPIASTITGKPLGEALKIVYLEKPEKTKYQVKLSKSVGKYKLDTYLYDKNGNVKNQEFSGKLNGSDIDIYNLNIKQSKNSDYEKRFYLFGRWFRYFLHSHDD